jgi:hypothetical protein
VSALLRAGLGVREWPHTLRFEAACARPDRAQTAVLAALLARNAGTAFGRAHGFAAIRTPAEFARAVPVRDYEAMRPYVRRIAAGEPGVLTEERVTAFATTSGTTGEPKLVPVTASWQAQAAALTRLWLRGAARDHPRLLDGALLTVVSPAIEGRTPGALPFGAMSGMLARGLPAPVRHAQALPYAVCLIADPETRYLVTMRLALAERVSAVGTPNPTTLLRLADTGARHTETILRAIHDGSLGTPWPPLREEPGWSAPATRRAIGQRLRPDPARARVLAAAARGGGLQPRDAWPGLALIGCWLGGAAGFHARRLDEAYGPAPRRELGLLASEGRITLPLEDETDAGVLAVHAGFFEFVPEDAIGSPAPPIRLAHELQRGLRYGIVLSGGNGLYRYDLNDVVEVRGWYRGAPRLAFIRKGRDMASIVGEKLHANHVVAAVQHASGVTGTDVWQFQLIPDVAACRYDLLVEPRGPLPAARGTAFARAVDEALGALNREYADRRASRRLAGPRLHVMRAGWAEGRCRAAFAEGRRDVQHKWPAIRLDWDAASRAEVIETWEPEAVTAEPDRG